MTTVLQKYMKPVKEPSRKRWFFAGYLAEMCKFFTGVWKEG
jgi:hypothetical protein